MKPIERLGKLCIEHPKRCFIVIGLISAFFLVFVPNLKLNIGAYAMFKEDDPDHIFIKKFNEQYGSDENLLILIDGENVFDPKVLSMIDRITKRIKELKDVQKVMSLTNVKDIRNVENKTGEENKPDLYTGSLVENPNDIDAKRSAYLKERALSNPIYFKSWIISKDAKTTAIVIYPYMVHGQKIYSSQNSSVLLQGFMFLAS